MRKTFCFAAIGDSLETVEQHSPISYEKIAHYQIPEKWRAIPPRKYLVLKNGLHLALNHYGEVYLFNPRENHPPEKELQGTRLDMENVVHMAGSEETGVFLMDAAKNIFSLSADRAIEKVGTADLPEEVSDFNVCMINGERMFFFVGQTPAYYCCEQFELEDAFNPNPALGWHDDPGPDETAKFYNLRKLFGPIANKTLQQTCGSDNHLVFLIKDDLVTNRADQNRIVCINLETETVSREFSQLGNVLRMARINNDHFIFLMRSRRRIELLYLFHTGSLIDAIWSSVKEPPHEKETNLPPKRGIKPSLYMRARALNDIIWKLRKENQDQYLELSRRITGFLEQTSHFWPVTTNTRYLLENERVNIMDMCFSNGRLYLFSDKRHVYEYVITYNLRGNS